MFSTPGRYHEYTGGVQYSGGYHDKCGGQSLGKQLNLYENSSVLNIPRCIAQTLCRVIVMKTWENAFGKTHENHFSGNTRHVLGQLFENLKINRKP